MFSLKCFVSPADEAGEADDALSLTEQEDNTVPLNVPCVCAAQTSDDCGH